MTPSDLDPSVRLVLDALLGRWAVCSSCGNTERMRPEVHVPDGWSRVLPLERDEGGDVPLVCHRPGCVARTLLRVFAPSG